MKLNFLGRAALAVVLLGVVFVIKGGQVPDLIDQLTGKASSVSAAAGIPPASSSADDIMSDMLQGFIGCINRVDMRLRQHFAEYETAWPARQAKQSPGRVFSSKIEVYATGNSMSKECADNIEKAVARPPADPMLDAAGKTYVATLRELIAVLNDVDAYYSQEDFRDNAMAKGRELDARLRPLFATLFSASDQFRGSVAAHDLRLTANELAAKGRICAEAV